MPILTEVRRAEPRQVTFCRSRCGGRGQIALKLKIRRGGRAVECTGLENRRPFTGLVSSNLTLSAKKQSVTGHSRSKVTMRVTSSSANSAEVVRSKQGREE